MFNKFVFWLGTLVDLLWTIIILWAGFKSESLGVFGWLLVICLALYPIQVTVQRFKIKRLEGE